MRPPLNIKLFPVHRRNGLKRAEWNAFLFFTFFENSFFSLIFSVHPSQHENEKKNPALPTGFFGGAPGGQATIFHGWPKCLFITSFPSSDRFGVPMPSDLAESDSTIRADLGKLGRRAGTGPELARWDLRGSRDT